METGRGIALTVSEIASSLIPGTGWMTEHCLARVAEERAQRASAALRAAESASRMSREELGEILEREPSLVPLYLQVLYAAGMNGRDDVLRAMGAALGLAAEAAREGDAEFIEDIEVALRAMKEFTPRHFMILESIATACSASTVVDDLRPLAASGIGKALGLSEERVAAILIVLSGIGLVTVTQTWDSDAYPISDLGAAIVEAAQIVSK